MTSRIIYLTLLILLVIIGVSLPFINISITVQSPSSIRPSSNISTIQVSQSGRVLQSVIKENESIKTGDTLLVLESESSFEQIIYLENKLFDLQSHQTDLIKLTSDLSESAFVNVLGLQSDLYKQAYAKFKQQVVEGNTRYRKSKTNYTRQKALHEAKVISNADLENHQYELDKSLADFQLMHRTQISLWQTELSNIEQQIVDINSQKKQSEKELNNRVVIAPISGTLINTLALYTGSSINAGQTICNISPDSGLVAEVWVKPSDIGLIKDTMKVKFQVAAFNYNQWGFASGKVLDISDDIIMIDNQPYFRVRCSIEQEYLELKNGYKGHLKKGMNMQARFQVTERTLWQLLYDKMDDWLNPYQG